MPLSHHEAGAITGYHAHIYYDAESREAARAVRLGIEGRFRCVLGRWHDQPVGPHPKAMYQVAFGVDEFAKIVPWLMLNRRGLDILVHPNTEDAIKDHDINPLWLGTKLALDIDTLRRFATEQAKKIAAG
ncbi:MAG: 4,5-dioxygenase [Alphaproteobacteria bacterium]|nr:4,5-dioxygenase [Alphaproteobacteria bacterium]